MRGLAADDFELAEDGKPSRIVSFQYIDTTEADEAEAVHLSPAARRHFLLLFDMSFTEPGGLHRAREAASEFVRRRLAPSDLAAVATFDVNRGIRIVANFTEDRPLLLQYAIYVRNIALGDFGSSILTRRPVTEHIWERLPATIELGFVAMVMSVLLGVPLGLLVGIAPLDPLFRGERQGSIEHGVHYVHERHLCD